MSEPSVEEIVARWERTKVGQSANIRALIASWRMRGEALKEAQPIIERANEERWAGAFGALHSIDAALKEQA